MIDINGNTQIDSNEALKNLNNYSTNEIRIGTWINGKPLYRKVIKNNNQECQNGTYIQTNITNFEDIINIYGLYNSVGNEVSIPINSYVASNNYFRLAFHNVGESIGLLEVQSSNTSSSVRKVIIVIEYTKTTD